MVEKQVYRSKENKKCESKGKVVVHFEKNNKIAHYSVHGRNVSDVQDQLFYPIVYSA